ncbi:MAG: ABC transporter ATP-binding protein, partial [Anaerolineales bacterium]|nr:ABC transporter ATP-binding protein [Anaerolineales bacterium]
VRVAGHDTVTEPHLVRREIGMLTEQPGLYERMTGMEYLHFYGRLYGLPTAVTETRGRELFARFDMPDAHGRRLGEFSKGMKQKVGLMRAMLHDPAVLLLDEPTSAMDPHSAKLVRDAIAVLQADKRSIILCTHNLAEAEQLADRIAIIKAGQVVARGTAAQLKVQLLGEPLLEIQLDQPLPRPWAQEAELAELVQIEAIQGDRLRFRTAVPQQTNPQLIRLLTGWGFGIVTLTHVSQSLEEVYLNVVAPEPSTNGHP